MAFQVNPIQTNPNQGTSEQIPRGRDGGFAEWDARKATKGMVDPLREEPDKTARPQSLVPFGLW
jgi:hypothetical protein